MADDDTPRNADFIGRVVSDAKNPPETRLLTGWFGDAADEGYRRLYTDAELSAYFDIPTDAILYTEPIRDVQPSGGVFVWIQRDAALKPGGSAASRAARFLQGQVQQDFASGGAQDPGSLEKAGFRCVTQVPCGEPTGFTGQCTKQPEVGGAWPCITAIPHCFEPTGFTGQCTHQPWPNPTHYIGCTFLHCPTQDLTHVPHICNIVATGMPGCPVVDPQGGGGDPAAKVDAAAGGKEGGGGKAVQPTPPFTVFPGCNYTHTWGLCATHPPKCNVSVEIPCITQDQACGITRNPACLANAGGAGFAAFRAVGPGPVIPIATELIQCNPSAVDACPTRLCQTQPPTALCTQIPEACPTRPPAVCPTIPSEKCPPTRCGPDCQTQQRECTLMSPPCTQAGPQCPTPGFECTMFCTHVAPQCPTQSGQNCPTLQPAACPPSQVGPACPTPTPPICFAARQAVAGPIGPSAFLGCTQSGPQCPTYPSGDCTFFGCPTGTQVGAAGPGTGCTQSGPLCPTHAQPHCTLFGAGCPPTPATVCTQFAPCPTHQGVHCPTPHFECTMFCTHAGPECPPFTQTFQCGGPSAVDACPTRLCGGGQQFFGAAVQPAWGGPPIGPTGFRGCTQLGLQCPTIGRENTYRPCTLNCPQTTRAAWCAWWPY